MGRTIRPYSMQLEFMRERFKKFRRALRKQDQDILDELFRQAKSNVQAGVMASSPNPMDSVLLSILVEQQRQIHDLRLQIKNLQDQMAHK